MHAERSRLCRRWFGVFQPARSASRGQPRDSGPCSAPGRSCLAAQSSGGTEDREFGSNPASGRRSDRYIVKRILLSWSSGKDSAWTLHLLRQQADVEVVGLLTTFNEAFDRVAM